LEEDINWNELWKQAKSDASIARRRRDKAGFWNKWSNYYNRLEHWGLDEVEFVVSQFAVDNHTSILDIGSGTGRLAVPLARVVYRVTAVDPAEGMLDRLRENAFKQDLNNITCINKKWEEVIPDEIGVHDIVVAAYSLDMPDLKSALYKMSEAAGRAVCIFWFAGGETLSNENLWPRLFGEPYIPFPDHIYPVNILYQLGIYPDIKIVDHETVQYYSDIEDAVRSYQMNYAVDTSEAMDILREHLLSVLIQKDGEAYIRRPMKSAVIWWHKVN
jgi:SAM-dependent methyltransferase